jgi:hypothetical protein
MTQDEHSALEITLSLANFRRKNQNKSKRAYRQKHDKPIDESQFKAIYEPGDDALNDKETLESVVKDACAEALSRAKRSAKKSFDREFEAIRDVIDDNNLSVDPPAMSNEERIRIFLQKHDTKTIFEAVCSMLKDRYSRESDEFIHYFSTMFSDVLEKKLSL